MSDKTQTSTSTIFLAQSSAHVLPPFVDTRRIYTKEHYPVIYICSNTGRRRRILLLDHPQRRWYELNIPAPDSWQPPSLTEAEEISLEARVKLYIESRVELFNVINIDDH